MSSAVQAGDKREPKARPSSAFRSLNYLHAGELGKAFLGGKALKIKVGFRLVALIHK